MTHDELMAMINPMTNNDAIFMKDALRAVVELHKPSGQGLGYAAYCHQCMFNHGSGEIKNHAYPCPTIQAIEKALE
jgi:hypothetical protein